jgi:hypothetical protein
MTAGRRSVSLARLHDAAAARADIADELVLLDLATLHGDIIASWWVWMVYGKLFGGVQCKGKPLTGLGVTPPLPLIGC